MKIKEIRKVSIIGAGNVAWHLSHALTEEGIQIDYIYNRTIDKAAELAAHCNAQAAHEIKQIVKSDLIVITVSDDAILEVVRSIPKTRGIIVHTSGNVSLEALFPHENSGVLYPLQSFRREVMLEIDQVPLLIEGNSMEVTQTLLSLARKLSKTIYEISSMQRRRLHIAAVFANNFVNHMYKQAEDICNEHDIPFEVLYPLIKETAMKVTETSPVNLQTGPAIRRDERTMGIHLDLLTPDQQELYRLISKSIQA